MTPSETADALWRGRLLSPRHSGAPTVSLRVVDNALVVGEAPGEQTPIPAAAITIIPPIGGTCWRFSLNDGSSLEVADGAGLALALGYRPHLLARLEASWRLALLALPLIIGVGALSWFYGVPFLADRTAAMVPPAWLQDLDETTVRIIRHQAAAGGSLVPAARQEALRGILADMVRSDTGRHYHMEFINLPGVGPNAFALPGGTVLVTDDLARLLNDEEFAAVLAHEIGHVQHRHGLRMAFRASSLSVMAALIVGDAGTAGHALVGIPVLLINLDYSRKFEAEADDAAFDWLSRDGRSPCAFSSALRRIVDDPAAKAMDGAVPGWLNNHPLTADRLRRFDQACKA